MKQKSKNENQLEHEYSPMTAIDLFSGGGGLTVGLKRAGFKVVSAVEIEPHAFSTYKANHPDVKALKQDIRTIHGTDLKALSLNNEITLLSGCPPCQGFSSLTSKNKKEDPRNLLIEHFGRLVEEIQPRAVMMENVPGLAQRGNSLFQKFIEKLQALGYEPEYSVLQVANYGVPQSRRRLVLFAGKGFKIPIPESTHSRDGENGLKKWRDVESVIKGMEHPLTLTESRSVGGPQVCNWHIVRTLSPENKRRLRNAKPGKGWTKIPKKYRPECHKDRKAGFSNVYGRMTWDQVAPTMTGGCTTFSKGRFGHPEEDRTISVREAALFQTFPEDYIIDTPHMDHACNIVGNALPCDFAEILSRQCMKYIQKSK